MSTIQGIQSAGKDQLTANEIEAANRAEATALLMRNGYRVYRPEADCNGEDLILRDGEGKLHAVQLKSRPTVDWARYGGEERRLLMLFPDPKGGSGRTWFLVSHDDLYNWLKQHELRFRSDDTWSSGHISESLRDFLKQYALPLRGILQ